MLIPLAVTTRGPAVKAPCGVTAFVIALKRRITNEFKTRSHRQPGGCRVHRSGVLDHDLVGRTLWGCAGAKRRSECGARRGTERSACRAGTVGNRNHSRPPKVGPGPPAPQTPDRLSVLFGHHHPL